MDIWFYSSLKSQIFIFKIYLFFFLFASSLTSCSLGSAELSEMTPQLRMAGGSFSKILNNNKFPCSDRLTLFIFKKMSSSVWIAVVCQFFSETLVFHRKRTSFPPKWNICTGAFPGDKQCAWCAGGVFQGHFPLSQVVYQETRCNRNDCDCFLKDILKVNWLFLTASFWWWRMTSV